MSRKRTLATQVHLEQHLYAEFEVDESCRGLLNKLIADNFQLDSYCVECRKESTFKTTRDPEKGSSSISWQEPDWCLADNLFISQLYCTRHGHAYTFLWLIKNRRLSKIGQHPSIEDISGTEIQKFRDVLGKQQFAELRRSNGLASHGVGIGSFVYLRRIFERLISEAYIRHVTEHGEIAHFHNKRMEEKIQSLRTVLPRTIVDNRRAYSILSMGLHELDEEACKSHFPVIKAAVIRMLEDDLQTREKVRADQKVKEELAALHTKLSGTSKPRKSRQTRSG